MFKERENFYCEEGFDMYPQSDPFHPHNNNNCSTNTTGLRKKHQGVSSLSASSGDEGSSPSSLGGYNNSNHTHNHNNHHHHHSRKQHSSITSLNSNNNNSSSVHNHHNNNNHVISNVSNVNNSGNGNSGNNNHGDVLGGMRCYGCGKTILARYYLFALEHHWHNECLKCQVCSGVLSDNPTCFEKDGRILCKQDYYRLYHKSPGLHPRRCARCTNLINPNDLVMRACDLVYHVDCFVCTVCQRPLNRGDQFRMQSTDLYCRLHYDMIENLSTPDDFSPSNGSPTHIPSSNKSSPANGKRGRPPKRKLLSGLHDNLKEADGSPDYFHPKPPSLGIGGINGLSAEFNQIMDTQINAFGLPSIPNGGGGGDRGLSMNCDVNQSQQKGKRMRTTFKHNQLRVMKSYFDMNPNPDTKDLKQLSQKTGLCKRVLQVWFQNARAKHRRTCPRSESSLSGSGILQLDDSEEWSPPQTYCQPTPTSELGNLIPA